MCRELGLQWHNAIGAEGLPSTLALTTGLRQLHGQRTSVHAQMFPSL